MVTRFARWSHVDFGVGADGAIACDVRDLARESW